MSFPKNIALCQQTYGWSVELTQDEREKFQTYFDRLGIYLASQLTSRQRVKWWWLMLPKIIRLAYALKWRAWLGASTMIVPPAVSRVLKKETVDVDSLKLTYCYMGLLITGRQKFLLPRSWQVIYLLRRWVSLVCDLPRYPLNNQPLTEN